MTICSTYYLVFGCGAVDADLTGADSGVFVGEYECLGSISMVCWEDAEEAEYVLLEYS